MQLDIQMEPEVQQARLTRLYNALKEELDLYNNAPCQERENYAERSCITIQGDYTIQQDAYCVWFNWISSQPGVSVAFQWKASGGCERFATGPLPRVPREMSEMIAGALGRVV